MLGISKTNDEEKLTAEMNPLQKVENILRKSGSFLRNDGDSLCISRAPNKLMIFDTVEDHFHADVFFLQLLMHLVIFFAPLSPNMFAQEFFSRNPFAFFFNGGLTIITYLMIISYFGAPSDVFEVMSGSIWIPLIYFLQHKLVVALKYASLSPSEYQRYMSVHDIKTLQIYQKQLQLVYAWLFRDESVLEFELAAAALRVGIKISDVHFILPNPTKNPSAKSQIHYWHAYLRGRDLVDLSINETIGLEKRPLDGKYQISVYDFCMVIIRRCDASEFTGQRLCNDIIYLFCFGMIIIPFIILGKNYHKIHQFSFVIPVFYLSSTLINFCVGLVTYNLLFVAVFDVMRQLKMVNELTTFIRLSDLSISEDPFITSINRKQQQEQIGVLTNVSSPSNNNNNKDSFMLFDFDPMLIEERLAQQSLDERTLTILSLNQRMILAPNQSNSRRSHIPISDRNRNSNNNSNNRSTITTMTPAVTTVNTANAITPPPPPPSLPRISSPHNNIATVDSADRPSQANHTNSYFDPSERYSHIGERIATDQGPAEIPRISFEDSIENILAWSYARLIFQNFGDRFRHRIDIYVGGTLSIIVLLIISALAQVFFSTNRLDAFNSAFFLQALLAICLVLLFTILVSYLSSVINDKFRGHK
jgi:hypothetical protein